MKQYRGGRPPKTDPCRHRYSFKLNDVNDVESFGVNEDTPKNDIENFGVNENAPKNDIENFGVNETQKQILKFISENPQITAGEMAYKKKQTKRNIEHNIKTLKSKGIIERFGSDKTGEYKIVTKLAEN